ncbi:hypothetical protein ACTHHL_15600 [Aeribacillus composti]|uniref:Uncharacterized protein n=1 Tax=Aeribacillus pallidus TaxID=33936 RepID=A0A161WTV4_9BACI|nr:MULTISPECIES: hypothetical protein [Aeribacillus]KZM53399.1 hypothetical protein A3Q35_02995 [Aeribacillus pallidus]KZN95354.1 hypothetical protein AZI98_15265 [Aeribacillus pallidus]MDR9796866.1 hypothetical protein [Aeribacillus pallidus]MED0649295.1 hypothetical protein [Aeribacillus composti]MED0716242.1 hypothetical protein [Aeribacillus composti]
MDERTKHYFAELQSSDKNAQYEAYSSIMKITEEEVDWAYEVWDQLKEELTSKDPHKRSRAAQFLSRLAISDPEQRMLEDFPQVWEVTYDKKFVTARHSLQAIWRIGLAGEKQKEMVIRHLAARFDNCVDEKHATLIRFDIIQGLRNLYDKVQDEAIKQLAFDLIEKEEDPKYQKKYAAVWK